MESEGNQIAQLKDKDYYVPLTLRGELIKDTRLGKQSRVETINNYEIICPLGEGGFAKVYKVKFVS